MKKLTLLLFLFSMNASSISQVVTENEITATQYIKRAKHRRAEAIALAASGSALLIVAMLTPPTSEVEPLINWPNDPNASTEVDNRDLITISALVGVTAIAGSIPLFISASKNKKRAVRMSLNNIPFPAYSVKRHLLQSVPSLCLVVKL
ncbi:MAG TPA: hypothetical protein VM012_14590 [Flavitalea sp.]|nr:hypothetical protein [Flavitalea sp.]